jgi:hypothetical protein
LHFSWFPTVLDYSLKHKYRSCVSSRICTCVVHSSHTLVYLYILFSCICTSRAFFSSHTCIVLHVFSSDCVASAPWCCSIVVTGFLGRLLIHVLISLQVDFQGNLNLLALSKQRALQKFVLVSSIGADDLVRKVAGLQPSVSFLRCVVFLCCVAIHFCH